MLSCNSDSDEDQAWDKYAGWREQNVTFYENQQTRLDENGASYYQLLSPSWNPTSNILIRYLNDRKLTEGNLTPMLTSTCDVKYIGRLCNDVPFDSSYTQVKWGDSIFRTTPKDVIQGWTIALTHMRVGDSAQIVIPYQLAYQDKLNIVGIPPYSTLVFNLKLVDIPYYEIRP